MANPHLKLEPTPARMNHRSSFWSMVGCAEAAVARSILRKLPRGHQRGLRKKWQEEAQVSPQRVQTAPAVRHEIRKMKERCSVCSLTKKSGRRQLRRLRLRVAESCLPSKAWYKDPGFGPGFFPSTTHGQGLHEGDLGSTHGIRESKKQKEKRNQEDGKWKTNFTSHGLALWGPEWHSWTDGMHGTSQKTVVDDNKPPILCI
nr:uncharacterized protein LOC131756785 [Kogia breviceps]